MTVFTENHPFSALSQQIEQIIWASVVFVSFVAAVALVNLGQLTLFIVPALVLVTMIHNLTLVGLISQDRKKSTEQLKGTLAPTATKFTIVITWILVALWASAAILLIVVFVRAVDIDLLERWQRLGGAIELLLVFAEIGSLTVLAVKCKNQRRKTIVQPETVDWQHFGPTASSRV